WLPNLFEVTQDKIFARGAPKEWFAVARTSRPETPDALQGFHASDIRVSADGRSIIETLNDTTRGQIMFVIDEAAGVSDRVFEVAEGALASPNSSLLMGGNPTRGTGYFANSHKQNRAICPCTWLNGHRCIRELVQFHTPSAENAGVFHRRYHQ